MEYIKIVNGKIDGHFCSKNIPKGKEYKIVTNFQGWKGCDIGRLNDDGSMKPEDELISLGFIKDNRDEYFNIETKRRVEIKTLDVEIPEGFTKLKPGDFDKWDGSEWTEDPIQVNENKTSKARQYLYDTDYRVIKAIESGVGLDNLYPGETAKRESARQTIRDLSNLS